MYAQFNNIDDLFNAVKEDKQADGVNSVTLNRYPMRFVLFDNFRDSYAFIIRMMQEMKVSMEEVQHWLDPDYPDYIISHSRLADEMGTYFKALKGESKIIAPFSELARFYDNDAKKQFDALIKTIKGFECLQEGWDKKQRIYIPIVGLEGKISTFFSDTQTTIWYLRAENQELNYRLILTDRTTYGVQNLESQYTIVKSVAEWLDFWRNKDYHEKPNIICSSRSIYANACYAQPDNAFTYCTCGSVYEFLNKGLGLSFSDIQYKEKDEEYWKELAKEVDLQSQFDFNVFFSRHFSMTQVEDYKAFIKLWFEYNDGFSRWLLINTYINKFGESQYLCRVLSKLSDESDRELFAMLALEFTNVKEEMDVRRYCMNEASKRGIQLTVEAQNDLQKKLLQIAASDGYHYAISLFTSMSVKEKELAITWLGKGLIQVNDVEHFYPELYHYLQPSTGTIDANQMWCLDYFNKYKKAKIADHYDEDVAKIIEERNGTPVKFNNWYQKFHTTNNILNNRGDIEVFYWIDGLGVDWIPLIAYLVEQKMSEKVFLNDAMIARAVLPTKTDINKENLMKLIKGNVTFEKIGDIDQMAHKNNNIYPNNIIAEIETVTETINELLRKYIGKKIAIVSDHGISYLSQTQQGLNLGGFESHHYGRYATKNKGKLVGDDNYFMLEDGKTVCALNHQSLCAKINTGSGAHGGCTPEEVLVPILIISSSPNNKNWNAEILNKDVSATDPVIHMKIVGLSSLDSPKVFYNGRSYNVFSVGHDLFDSEPIELKNEVTDVEIRIGETSEIKKISVQTGGQEDDLFAGMI